MRRSLGLFLCVALVLNSISASFSVVFAASSLKINTFSINNYNSSIFIAPWSNIRLYLEWINNWTVNLNNVYWKIIFDYNSDITYYWDIKWWINQEQNVPTSEFSESSWLNALITRWTDTPLKPGEYPYLYSYPNSQSFKVKPEAKNYLNSVKWYFEWSDWTTTLQTSQLTRYVYVNVKPHITDYYFEKADGSQTTSQVQWGNAEAVNFVMKVKDYNTCSNIDWWVVTANLSQLWLSSSEPLNYVSCDSDWKTAIFKKVWITTLAALWSYTFSYSNFSAKDEDNNLNDPTDPNTTFDSEDKLTNISLSVVSAWAPVISKTSPSEPYIWPNKSNSSFDVSSDKDWQYAISIWSDWSCNWGTSIVPWTGSWYLASTLVNVSINQSQLSEWINKIYFCFKNLTDEIWSDYVEITKDSTSPQINSITVSPWSVTWNDPVVSFACSENGSYQVNPGWYSSWNIVATQINYQTIANSNLSEWSNSITITCYDKANNSVVWNTSVNKTTAAPTMSWAILSFSDSDIDYDWLDWRDLHLTWDNSTITSYTYFESYRLYLLPSSVTFDKNSQTYIKILPDKNLSSWDWDETITKDSTNTTLVSGWSYKMCVAVMPTSGQLWEAWCSAVKVITADTVQHPSILSAKFTSDTNLELTTDATLDTATWWHNATLISYMIWWSVFTWSTVSSINSKILNITIPSLWSKSATWTSLLALTWAIHSFSGWFNDYFSSWSFVITDWQAPVISALTNNTVSSYSGFYKWTINFSYTLWENLKWAWATYIKFTRTAWNPSSDKYYNITTNSKLAAWTNNENIDLNSLGLVSGTTYDIQLIWVDYWNNIWNSNTISIKYDNNWPAMMTILPVWIVWIINPTLNWLSTVDDLWFWAWVKSYSLNIYTWSTCSGSFTFNIVNNPLSLNIQINLVNLNNYAWNITPIDNLWNTWTTSACDSFTINTFKPAFSSAQIKDTALNSVTYAKWGDNIEIQSNITNTDINHIWIDASSLKDSSYANISCASPVSWVTCSYNSWIAKYIFSSWFWVWLSSWVKQAKFTSSNISWINTWSVLTSITLDNSAPVIAWWTITSPIAWSIFWWTSKNITWNTSWITDNIALSYLKFEYSSNWWSSWNLIWTWSNSSPYVWNIWAISDGSNYKLRITAYDVVWNSSNQAESNIFTIDKTAPSIWAAALAFTSQIYKANTSASITWNSASITDANLWTTPISLQYTIDNWTNWINISSNLSNNWSLVWTTPSWINSNQVKLKMIVTDVAGNTWQTISSSSYIIDSTLPVVNVTFAWNWWSTPQNWKYINDSWIDITASATDNYLSNVKYTFENRTQSQYFWEWFWWSTLNWNILCTDSVNLWTNPSDCSDISHAINPAPITDGESYRLTVRWIDEAGNEKDYNYIDYIWDKVAPNLTINTLSWAYFSWSINISWTASDTGSNLSSTSIEIKKWTTWWNWTSWVWSQQILATSWTPTSWNYIFNPSLDSDGSVYKVIITSYDNTYKTPNSTSKTIYINKDTSWPVIATWVFTSSFAWVKKWWTSYNLTWDTSKITSTGSSVNHISLKYNLNWTIYTLSWNTANTWNYTFNLPLVDNSIKILITAYDDLWNSSNIISSSDLFIDSTPPSILKVETVWDTNGKLSWLLVYFSENVTILSSSIANFSISWMPLNNSNYSTSVWASWTILNLNFLSSTWTTASTPTLNYTSWSWDIEDVVSNVLATTSKVAIDKADPILQKIEAYDNDSNGKIDTLKAFFSENISASSTMNWLSLNSSLPWMSLSSISISGWNDYMTINLSESTIYDTSSSSIDLSLNNSIYTDTSWNLAWNFSNHTVIDKAKPILYSISTYSSKNDGNVDKVKALFSESLSWSLTGFSLNSFPALAYTWTLSLSWTTLSFNLNSTNIPTSQTWNLNYTPWNLQDVSWNSLSPINWLLIADKVAPKIISSNTVDSDWNWKIDSLYITMSENLKSNTWTFLVDTWSYIVSNVVTSWTWIFASLIEKNIEDTSIIPIVSLNCKI